MTIGKEEILDALNEVMDPEIPSLSVIDLGIIENVAIEEDRLRIVMLPTFIACPAIKLIQQQIRDRLSLLGFEKVVVEVNSSVPWTSDRISEEGKRKLEKFGLGTPQKHHGDLSLAEIEGSKCPHCGSSDTTMNSLFGSTLCRSIHFCFDCRQSFERFKPL